MKEILHEREGKERARKSERTQEGVGKRVRKERKPIQRKRKIRKAEKEGKE